MDQVGSVGLLCVVADLKFAARGVVGIVTLRTGPGQAWTLWDRCIRFVEMTVDRGIPGKTVGLGAIRESIDVGSAGRVHERERGKR